MTEELNTYRESVLTRAREAGFNEDQAEALYSYQQRGYLRSETNLQALLDAARTRQNYNGPLTPSRVLVILAGVQRGDLSINRFVDNLRANPTYPSGEYGRQFISPGQITAFKPPTPPTKTELELSQSLPADLRDQPPEFIQNRQSIIEPTGYQPASEEVGGVPMSAMGIDLGPGGKAPPVPMVMDPKSDDLKPFNISTVYGSARVLAPTIHRGRPSVISAWSAPGEERYQLWVSGAFTAPLTKTIANIAGGQAFGRARTLTGLGQGLMTRPVESTVEGFIGLPGFVASRATIATGGKMDFLAGPLYPVLKGEVDAFSFGFASGELMQAYEVGEVSKPGFKALNTARVKAGLIDLRFERPELYRIYEISKREGFVLPRKSLEGGGLRVPGGTGAKISEAGGSVKTIEDPGVSTLPGQFAKMNAGNFNLGKGGGDASILKPGKPLFDANAGKAPQVLREPSVLEAEAARLTAERLKSSPVTIADLRQMRGTSLFPPGFTDFNAFFFPRASRASLKPIVRPSGSVGGVGGVGKPVAPGGRLLFPGSAGFRGYVYRTARVEPAYVASRTIAAGPLPAPAIYRPPLSFQLQPGGFVPRFLSFERLAKAREFQIERFKLTRFKGKPGAGELSPVMDVNLPGGSPPMVKVAEVSRPLEGGSDVTGVTFIKTSSTVSPKAYEPPATGGAGFVQGTVLKAAAKSDGAGTVTGTGGKSAGGLSKQAMISRAGASSGGRRGYAVAPVARTGFAAVPFPLAFKTAPPGDYSMAYKTKVATGYHVGQAEEIISSSDVKTKVAEAVRVAPLQYKTRMDELVGLKVASRLGTSNAAFFGGDYAVKTKTDVGVRVATRVKVAEAITMRQQTIQRMVTQLRIVPRMFPRPGYEPPYTPSTPRIFPKSPLGVFEKLGGVKTEPGFKVLVRRRGKFMEFGGVGSRAEAFNRGVSFVRNTLGASFKTVQAGFIPSRPGGSFALGKDVAPSKREAGVFVQARKFRISSAGEKAEIKRARRGFI